MNLESEARAPESADPAARGILTDVSRGRESIRGRPVADRKGSIH